MSLEITEEERNLMLQLIESAETAVIRSIDHADSHTFKDVLRNRLEILASAKEKIRASGKRAA
jgi:hypothetical protein